MSVKEKIHFLEWQRFRMACGKAPQEISDFTSYWSHVTCRKCLKREPLGSVVKA